jgi:hypothetical protein
MLEKMCAECRNYFVKDIHFGTFKIESGAIEPLDFLQKGQYFRIVGSVFNDGIYQYPAVNLFDETFHGAIWAMSVPPSFIALASDIKTWQDKDGKPSAYTSESFGGYSYTKATNAKGQVATWKEVFASQLNQYRRANIL